MKPSDKGGKKQSKTNTKKQASVRENRVETKAPKKNRKAPLHRSRKAISRNDHDSNPRFDSPASNISQNCACPENAQKNHFQKELGSAAPRAFWPQNTISSKIGKNL